MLMLMKTTLLSQIVLFPYQSVFHTHHQIRLNFERNFERNSLKERNATYCGSVPTYIHYSDQDMNFFPTLK